MKKFLPIAFMVTCAFSVKAGVWRCGFSGNQTNIDNNTLQSAHDRANPGDTILLFPTQNWNAQFTKQIVLIGTGYFVNTTTKNNGNGVANMGLQILNQSTTCTLNLAPGSDNSTIEGVDGLALSLLGNNQNARSISGVTVSRCNGTIIFWAYTQCNGVREANSFVNITINRSFINQLVTKYTTYNYDYCNSPSYYINNLTVNNCVISNCDLTAGLLPAAGNNGSYTNCIFYNGPHNFEGGQYLVQNSIFTVQASNDASVGYAYCMYNTDAGNWAAVGNGLGGNNIGNSFSKNQVFVDYPTSNNGVTAANNYSPDAGLAIIKTTIAKNAGSDGTDLGIYGGPTPYQLSGLVVPAFYKLKAPGLDATTSPYKITFSVKSHN